MSAQGDAPKPTADDVKIVRVPEGKAYVRYSPACGIQ